MARTDWQFITGSTNNNNAFFTGIRWRYRDDLFGTSGYPTDRTSSNTDIIEYQPYVGKKSSAYTSNYYANWLSSNYKYSYNTESGNEPGAASNQLNVSTTFRFDKASTNTTYYLTNGSLSSGNVMNTNSSNTSRIIEVPHCSDGTSKLRLYFYFAGNSGTSFTYAETNGIVTLETIPRASQITVNDANIGSATNIVINKASSGFTTTLWYKAFDENDWTKIVDKTANQVYGWIVPTSFYSKIPNAKTMTCQFKADTYNGETLIGTSNIISATFTATGNPYYYNISILDVYDTTKALTGDNTKMIKYASNMEIFADATGLNGSSIVSITVNGTPISLTGDVRKTGSIIIYGASTNQFVITATDSRGYATTETHIISAIDYIPITINANIVRNQPTDGKIKISYSGNWFNGDFGVLTNAMEVQYRSKEKGTSWDNVAWTNLSPVASGNTYSQNNYVITTDSYAPNGYDYTKQYEFQIRVYDRLQSRTIEGISISKGQPVYNWDEDEFDVNVDAKIRRNVAVGTIATKNIFNINGNINIKQNNGNIVKKNFLVDSNVIRANINGNDDYGAGQQFTNLQGKTFTFSAKCSNLGTGTRGIIAISDGYNQVAVKYISLNDYGAITYTATTNNIIVSFSTENGENAYFTDIQVELGNERTSWVPYQNIEALSFINKYQTVKDSAGWYRTAIINDLQTNVLLTLSTGYFNSPPSSVMISILTVYSAAKISQLNAVTFSSPSITKIRVQYDSSTRVYYVDFYYTPNDNNGIYVKSENVLDTEVYIFEPYLVDTEYTTLQEITIAY